MVKFCFLRDLRMLSLVLGSRITDAAVTAIVSCCTSLELLDLSGYVSFCAKVVVICSYYLQISGFRFHCNINFLCECQSVSHCLYSSSCTCFSLFILLFEFSGFTLA